MCETIGGTDFWNMLWFSYDDENIRVFILLTIVFTLNIRKQSYKEFSNLRYDKTQDYSYETRINRKNKIRTLEIL